MLSVYQIGVPRLLAQPNFQTGLIKEFQRLKEFESSEYAVEWDVKRILTKVNYRIHTDAIKYHIIPSLSIEKDKEWIFYTNEANLLNVALFGCAAKACKEANPMLALQGLNVRDTASINELTVLSNLESFNSFLIKRGMNKGERFEYLKGIVKDQLKSLSGLDFYENPEAYTKRDLF